ncbi:MAG: hypothetical protein Q4P34_05410 [Tissierellia bacterium]|nr:hypothetical protein [Tissierellia bacterium]
MDIYKKKRLKNLALAAIMAVAIYLQFFGRKQDGWGGLGIQFISLGMILIVLWIYNRRYR